MISVELIKDAQGNIKGFSSVGHAGFADSGEDIICAAVSALVINAVNSILKLTDDKINIDQDAEEGRLICTFAGDVSNSSMLLVDSLFIGLKGIEKEYGNQYIIVKK